MRTTLAITFLGFDQAGKRIGSAYFTKELQLPFAPSPGLELEDSAWKGAMKVVDVTWNIENQEFYVLLGLHEIRDVGSPDHFRELMKPYELSGWKNPIDEEC